MEISTKKIISTLGIPRLIIITFMIVLCVMAVFLKLPLNDLLSDTLIKNWYEWSVGSSYGARYTIWNRA